MKRSIQFCLILWMISVAAMIVTAEDGICKLAPAVRPFTAPGISNSYQLSERIYSGSMPEGEAAFAALEKMGIKTIITVDGMKPDADLARRFGIRYVHLPIGYDSVPTNQAARLVKAVETIPGPIFMHCHHGMHRGPSAAAEVCMATAGWTSAEAYAWLKLIGTSTNYGGLYRSVEQFHAPTADALKKVSADFSEKSPVSPLADTMIEIDGRFDNLKLIKNADYHTPVTSPDLVPAQESLLLNELFRELLRSNAVTNHSPDFYAKLNEAVSASGALHSSIQASPLDVTKADASFQRITDACAACHKQYRNQLVRQNSGSAL